MSNFVYSRSATEKEAAAKRVAALWRSRMAAQQQLVLANVPPRIPPPRIPVSPPRGTQFPWRPISKERSSRREPVRSRSFERRRPRSRERSGSRNHVSSSDNEWSDRSSGFLERQRRRRSISNADATAGSGSKIPRRKGKASQLSDVTSKPEISRAKSLIGSLLKSVILPRQSRAPVSSRHDLLGHALIHPWEAGR
jgi:hypothetical protein